MKTYTITASHSAVAPLTICVDAENDDAAFEYAALRFLGARGIDASEIIFNAIEEAR